MPKENKYKVGSLVKIDFPKGTNCNELENSCVGQVGKIKDIDELGAYNYTVQFEKEICVGHNRCVYNENEMTTPTQKEQDRYWLMIFKNV